MSFAIAEAWVINLAEVSPVLLAFAGTGFAFGMTIMVVATSRVMMTGSYIPTRMLRKFTLAVLLVCSDRCVCLTQV